MLEGTDLRGSVAYAGRIAVAAVTPAAGTLGFGIDAEARLDPVRDRAGWDGVPVPGRRGTVREWTRIEAALKADGRGLAVDPGRVVVRERPDGTWSATLPGRRGPAEGWDVLATSDLVVSAAILRQ
ncbi:hypothetical protein [Microbacterium sp. SLBN-154]|uniref:hypothetical protein n=1 Tax=Microbacterium sp. SLBN-154 TaxID=2768458 RepID=UPI00135CF0E7|nr:hypothetical protein [Microbacterium sp. SLBN-154]